MGRASVDHSVRPWIEGQRSSSSEPLTSPGRSKGISDSNNILGTFKWGWRSLSDRHGPIPASDVRDPRRHLLFVAFVTESGVVGAVVAEEPNCDIALAEPGRRRLAKAGKRLSPLASRGRSAQPRLRVRVCSIGCRPALSHRPAWAAACLFFPGTLGLFNLMWA